MTARATTIKTVTHTGTLPTSIPVTIHHPAVKASLTLGASEYMRCDHDHDELMCATIMD